MQKIIRKEDFTITNVVIAITVLMYFIQTNIQYGTVILGLNINFYAYDFWWQPLSSMFSHGGLMHLVMNMFVLWQIGNPIEKYRGKIEFVVLYFVLGILTSLISFSYIYYFDNAVNLIGASGAICVLLGYYAYFSKAERKNIITWILVISVLPLVLGLPIAWYAHFIGLGLGFVYAFLRRK